MTPILTRKHKQSYWCAYPRHLHLWSWPQSQCMHAEWLRIATDVDPMTSFTYQYITAILGKFSTLDGSCAYTAHYKREPNLV